MFEKLVQPLKWHGGKNAHQGKLARWIISKMGPHLTYCEPFAGGLAVLLWKDPEGVNEIVNDLNGHLTNFWRTLQREDTFARFQRYVEAAPFSPVEWNDAGDRLDVPDSVARAGAFFVHSRQSLAGRMDGFATLSTGRTRRGMNEQVSAWLTAVEGLAAVHARLKRVAILCMPAVDMIRKYDGPQTLFYCDPPYLHETRASMDTYRQFEMTLADHREFLAVVRQCQGKVMVSGYPNGLYDQTLWDWNRHTFEVPNHAAGGETKRTMTETLWCNF